MMSENPDHNEIDDFPFPLTEGPEPKYLTWVRNRSNYMAVRGPLDYLRAIGVLLRGILVNFLIFLPYLLGVSLVVAASHFLQWPPPFRITGILLIGSMAWILAFPVGMPYFRIVRYRNTRVTGSDSSVNARDRYERSFGVLLLAILTVGAVESLPVLLPIFHAWRFESDFDWKTIASTLSVATAIFGGARKLLSVMGAGIAKALVLVLIGSLGVLVPLLFVLFVSDFLVYGSAGDRTIWATAANWLFPAGIIFAIGLGVVFRAFARKDSVNISLLFIVSIGFVWFGLTADNAVVENFLNKRPALSTQAITELQKRPDELEILIADVAERPGPKLKKLSDDLDELHEYLAKKRDFFAQRPMDTDASFDQLREYLNDTYRNYRARTIAFYGPQANTDPSLPANTDLSLPPNTDPSLPKSLEELLPEFYEELASEARHVEGLSSVVKLVHAIDLSAEKRSFQDSATLLHEVHSLYLRTVTLRELFRAEAPRELAANLFALPYENLESLYSVDYPLLQKLHEHEFADAQKSLVAWGGTLKEVRDELDVYVSYPDLDFFESIEKVAGRPGSSFNRLIHDLEEYRKNAIQKRYLFSRAPVDVSQLQELLEELIKVGHDAGLYPEVDELVEAIRKMDRQDIPDALMPDLHRLYSMVAIHQDLDKPRSLKELAATIMTVPNEDFDELCDGDGFCYLYNTFPSAEKMQKNLQPKTFRNIREEFVATASLSRPQAEFYATSVAEKVRVNAFWPKFIFVSMLAVQLWFLSWLTMDVNLSSIHGLYRDRLASAFLVGQAGKDDIGIDKDLDLMDICCHEAGSIAPYHLINVALNLQGSKDINIRDRNSDFFIFSKKFIGGEQTGYCRSESMEQVFPQMDLATAMAISAAAASPNMGRGTNPALVAIMTLLNIRLGFWLPNPGVLEDWLPPTQRRRERETRKPPGLAPGFWFDEVFREELNEIEARWLQLGNPSERQLVRDKKNQRLSQPTPEHGLVGIGYSGGGIRSATLNLGITQALHKRGVFDHVDYMSTVSGGGYLGSSISALMRRTTRPVGELADTANTEDAKIDGKQPKAQNSVSDLFHWRVRPGALTREILSKLDENSRLVNVSDGGHIENLAGIELLRRRCKYIIIGDGEADPDHHFNGLATLIRSARIDLGVNIHVKPDALRLGENRLSQGHWAIGRIQYPGERTPGSGYLLYLKSSVTGEEDEVIQEYRHAHPSFPHESTADQFFGEGQFEAYRSLGQHIGEQVLQYVPGHSDPPERPGPNKAVTTPTATAASTGKELLPFTEFEQWFTTLDLHARKKTGEGAPV